MKNILSKILKKSVFNNSEGIVHIGAIILFGVLVVGAAVIIYVNGDGTTVRERFGPGTDVETQDDSDTEEGHDADDEDSNDDGHEDKDDGAYHVLFNDDSIKGTMGETQPTTIEIELKDAWAQTCDGLYSGWEGTAIQTYRLTTGAGTDERSGEGEFSFVVNKGDGKLSADKSTITIKHQVNCTYCEDPWIELTGKVVGGSKEACK